MKRAAVLVLVLFGGGCLAGVPALAAAYRQNAPSVPPRIVRPSPPSPGARTAARKDFGRLPLYFVANGGQIAGPVAFFAQGRDRSLYFAPEGLTLVLDATDHRPAAGAERWAVKLDFVGANRDVRPAGLDETGALISYFRGRPKEWRAGLPAYSKIAYRDLWPGIDLVYFGGTDKLKYEFVVHPGADPARIRLRYRGVTTAGIDPGGNLAVKTPVGDFEDERPTAYQEAGPGRESLAVAFEARGGGKETQPSGFAYGFRVEDYDRTRDLVIDPALLVYCGFIGGSGDDYARGVAVDSLGCAYVVGNTTSSEASFPVNAGPDLTQNGGTDIFVAKVAADGKSLIYCGYIGGSGDDSGYAIAVDSAGSAYIAGTTTSTEADFPVTVGPDLIFNGGTYDGFVTKVNPSGTALEYCGYIGGAGNDFVYGIAVAASGAAYLAGQTNSDEATFPVAVGPNLAHSVGFDAFVAEVSPSGAGLTYCGYIGGAGDDDATGVAVDGSGSAYVGGLTGSTEASFPVTVGPKLAYNGGDYDAFVAKVDPSGASLVYCGYVGGAGFENACGIAVDSAGCAYIAGHTNSTETTFPVTVGPDLTFNGGSWDAYAAKIKAAGDGLVFCGYIGGAGDDLCYNNNAIAVDASENASIVGYTTSTETSFPVAAGPDLSHNGGQDVFVARVNWSGTRLVYCGYIGGSADDLGRGIAVDSQGNAYVTGLTSSTASTFPVIAGPDLSQNGPPDAFIAKISYADVWAAKSAVGHFHAGGGDEAVVDFAGNGLWLYEGHSWTQISPLDSEILRAADVDGDGTDELVAGFGALGLRLWQAGSWRALSWAKADAVAAGDVDGDGAAEIVGAFGELGVWLLDAGVWTALTGSRADYVTAADVGGTAGDEIIADFGPLGLWLWSSTGGWSELSGADADYVTAGKKPGGAFLAGDFGPVGLWAWSSGAWLELSGRDADYVITADTHGDGQDEIVSDFGALGLWLRDGGTWTQLSGVNADFLLAADVDGDGRREVAADFGPVGLWLWGEGAWTQLSGFNANHLLSGDFDGDGRGEIIADFGAAGVWLWNEGAWAFIRP